MGFCNVGGGWGDSTSGRYYHAGRCVGRGSGFYHADYGLGVSVYTP